MGGLHWPPEMGSWVWDGVSLIWPGGHPEDLEQTWSAPQTEQDNLPQPGVDGSLPRDVLIVEQEIPVRFLLSGLWLPNGTPASNVAHGIAANYRELIDRIGTPTTWPTRRGVETTVVDASGWSMSGLAQGQVGRLKQRRGSVGHCDVFVTLPAGALVVEGS